MLIDTEKHRKKMIMSFETAIHDITELHNDHENLREIIEMAVAWYESDNVLDHSFFRKALGEDFTSTGFFGTLHSFLANTILDDSYYKICWEKFNVGEGEMWIRGTAWVDKPYVMFTHDGDPDRQYTPDLLWKAMKFMDDKDKERTRMFEEMGL